MTPPTLVLLAAGLGTRFGGLKQLDPVGPNGAALLDYAIADAARAGFGQVVAVVREEIEDRMRAHVERTVQDRLPVAWVRQRVDDLPPDHPPSARTKPWGTAHAVWAARHAVTGAFAVANTDDHYGPTAYAALARHFEEHEEAWAVVGYRLGATLSRPQVGGANRARLVPDENLELREVYEVLSIVPDKRSGFAGTTASGRHIRLSADDWVSQNLWGFTPSVFPVLEEGFATFLGASEGDPATEFLIPDAVDKGIRHGRCRVRVLIGGPDCFGMTFPEDRPEVAKRLAARGAPWAGRTWTGGPSAVRTPP
ncbi:MAG TPA: NTP transferase domain-containing protein [Longimicrobiales bacterium]|jgi:hypothetical protein